MGKIIQTRRLSKYALPQAVLIAQDSAVSRAIVWSSGTKQTASPGEFEETDHSIRTSEKSSIIPHPFASENILTPIFTLPPSFLYV